MMNRLLAFLLFLLPLFGVSSLQASHIAGGTITYTCTGPDTYVIRSDHFRHCAGAPVVAPILTITGTGSGCTQPTSSGWTLSGIVEVTPLAPGQQSNCNGGSIPGVDQWTYLNTYDFSGVNCLEYDFHWTSCCRSGTITSGQGNQDYWIEGGSIRPGQSPCNNSPQWRSYPVTLIAAGQSAIYDAGAYDPDGDSLVHSLTACLTTNGNTATYAAGYSPSQPLGGTWSLSIDPDNGFLTFLAQPGNSVVGVVCVKAEEYRNGLKIGEVTREFTVSVVPGFCTMSSPPSFTGVTNLNNVYLHSSGSNADTFYVHPGTAFCFDVTTNDPDTGDPQTLTWDQTIPGATFTDPGNTMTDFIIDEDPTGRFCWTAPSAIGYIDFALLLRDSSCMSDMIVPHSITIAVADTSLVWPGDANNDLIANNLDLLAVGLAFGSNGPARSSVSTAWQGFVSLPWMDTIPGGIDKKFQDCDGDGQVGALDPTAILLNYGLTHTKARAAARGAATDPPLQMIIPQDSASVGDTIEAIIILGDSSISASDVYGIAFTINYDASLVDSTTFSIAFSPSWIGNGSNSLELDYNHESAARCDAAQVRTDQQNVSGMGQIATASFIIIDNIDGKRNLFSSRMLNFSFSDVVLISNDGSIRPVDPYTDSVLVYQLSTEFEPGQNPTPRITGYPNPADDGYTLESAGSPIREVEIWNLHGQMLMRQTDLDQEKIHFSLNHFRQGVYFLKVRNDVDLHTIRLTISR